LYDTVSVYGTATLVAPAAAAVETSGSVMETVVRATLSAPCMYPPPYMACMHPPPHMACMHPPPHMACTVLTGKSQALWRICLAAWAPLCCGRRQDHRRTRPGRHGVPGHPLWLGHAKGFSRGRGGVSGGFAGWVQSGLFPV